MRLLIQFTSEAWRGYAASLANDADAWQAQNPETVEMGPFDDVVVEHGRVIGTCDGEAREVARCGQDEPWRLEGRQRPYDRLQVVMQKAADFIACVAAAWLQVG